LGFNKVAIFPLPVQRREGEVDNLISFDDQFWASTEYGYYDYGFGLPKEVAGQNSTRTISVYDGFGRPTSMVVRDGGNTLLSQESYAYTTS
jgi:hypothetical protein